MAGRVSYSHARDNAHRAASTAAAIMTDSMA